MTDTVQEVENWVDRLPRIPVHRTRNGQWFALWYGHCADFHFHATRGGFGLRTSHCFALNGGTGRISEPS